MDSIDLIRDNLARSTQRVLERVEDMRDHAFVFPTPNGGGHTLWVLGHLAYVEALTVREFMLGEENPLADWQALFDGATVLDAKRYPSFDETLACCREQRARTIELITSYTEADLDQASAKAPPRHIDLFGTRRKCLQYVVDHWYMHRGQLADARRAAGLERMWL